VPLRALAFEADWLTLCTAECGACADKGSAWATDGEASEGGCLGAHKSCSYFFLQSSTRSSLEAFGPGLAALQSLPTYFACAAAFPKRCIWAISSGPHR